MALHIRVHLIMLSMFFLLQYFISLLYQSLGTCFFGIICSGYNGCIYFEWLFYYTHIIFPGINLIAVVIWLYMLFMCPECFPVSCLYRTFPWYSFPLVIAIITPYYLFNSAHFSSQYIDDLLQHSIRSHIIFMFPSLILSMLILIHSNCLISSSHAWSLLFVLFIQISYYMDLTYLRMKS
eukprot:124572_1